MKTHEQEPARRASDAEFTEEQLEWWDNRPEDTAGLISFPREDGGNEVVQTGVNRTRLKGTLGGEVVEDHERMERMSDLLAAAIFEGIKSQLDTPKKLRDFILQHAFNNKKPGTLTVEFPQDVLREMDMRGKDEHKQVLDSNPNERQKRGIENRYHWLRKVESLVRQKVDRFLADGTEVKLTAYTGIPDETVGLDWKEFIGEASPVLLSIYEDERKAIVRMYTENALSKLTSIHRLQFGHYRSPRIEEEPRFK